MMHNRKLKMIRLVESSGIDILYRHNRHEYVTNISTKECEHTLYLLDLQELYDKYKYDINRHNVLSCLYYFEGNKKIKF